MTSTVRRYAAATLNEIYDLLVRQAGAPEHLRESFLVDWPECVEFRFCGSLGFGGKIWHDRMLRGYRDYVSFYPEDETAERVATRDHVNEMLAIIASAGEAESKPSVP